jgi:hypothetical protein
MVVVFISGYSPAELTVMVQNTTWQITDYPLDFASYAQDMSATMGPNNSVLVAFGVMPQLSNTISPYYGQFQDGNWTLEKIGDYRIRSTPQSIASDQWLVVG